MSHLRISSVSKQYVRSHVEAEKNGVEYDPTGDVVHFAFTATDDVDGATWNAGSWETSSGRHYARCLIGPDAVVLTKGTYVVHVRVTDNPEAPADKVGMITIY